MFGLKIENFRSLKNEEFQFSRINILIGENSSGKSSLLKFLMFLKKSEELFSGSFRFTKELGRYSDIIYSQDDSLNISFTLIGDSDYINFFNDNFQEKDFKPLRSIISKLSKEQQAVSITYSFGKDVQITNDISVKIENSFFGAVEIKRNVIEGAESVMEGKSCTLTYKPKKGKTIIIPKLEYDQHGFLSIIHGKDLKEKIKKKRFKENWPFYEIAYLLVIQNHIRFQIQNLRYLNPLESTPERVYEENEKQGMLYPSRNIQDVVNILSDSNYDSINRNKLLEALNKALRKYGILHKLKINSSDFSAREVQVQVKKDGIWSNIKDVGYGSALQIPIIFQSIVGEFMGGEIILIEQPEVHIHPFLQAKFIETLLSIGKNNTYIIETHSPDFVRKLQVLVKNKEFGLDKNSQQIYYFRKEKNDSLITNHKINEFGNLLPSFPSGFYDTSVNLVKALF